MPEPDLSKRRDDHVDAFAYAISAEHLRRAHEQILCRQAAYAIHIDIMGTIGGFQRYWARHGLH